MIDRIRAIHHESRQTYGAPRVHRELLVEGNACNEKTVAKLMKAAGIQAKTMKRLRVTTTDSSHGLAVAPNLVKSDFEWNISFTFQQRMNRRIVAVSFCGGCLVLLKRSDESVRCDEPTEHGSDRQ